MASTTSVDLLAPVHRLSVERYGAIAEQGLFDNGPTVELIDGILVEMSPIGTPHLLAVMWLNRELVPQLSRELHPRGAAVGADRGPVLVAPARPRGP